MSESEFIILTIIVLISWLIVAPILCYYTFVFFKLRRNMIIHKRYPKLILVLAICVILTICIERPIYLFYFTLLNDKNINKSSVYPMFWPGITLYHLIHVPIYWILLIKYWLIYFKINWTKHTLNSKWKIHLNHDNTINNWYIKNKSKYGNYRWVSKRIIIILLIITTISFFCFIILYKHKSFLPVIALTQFTLFFIPMISIFILYYKMRLFQDQFFVIQENKTIAIIIAVHICLYLIAGVLLGGNAYLRAVWVTIQALIWLIIIVLIQTLWIVRIVKNKENIHDPDNGNSNDENCQTLTCILKEEKSFELFMEYLAKEWSMETLLAFIEFTQFQYEIKQNFCEKTTNKYNNNGDLDSNMEFELISFQYALLENKCIPSSFIVYNKCVTEIIDKYNIKFINDNDENKLSEFKVRCYALYIKYIKDDSDLAINISYEQRLKLSLLMNDGDVFLNNIKITANELFVLYEDIVHELAKLLTHSRYRFALKTK